MLTINLPEFELFDEKTETFIRTKPQSVRLEHSLLSISKWESKWHKPFLGNRDKTDYELRDYIRMMIISQSDIMVEFFPQETINEIAEYINDPMTATTFREVSKRYSREIITSEIIYYWMIQFQIPFECQKWHLNRLLTLIKVCNEKAKPPGKKMSKRDLLQRNRELNALRRERMNSKG